MFIHCEWIEHSFKNFVCFKISIHRTQFYQRTGCEMILLCWFSLWDCSNSQPLVFLNWFCFPCTLHLPDNLFLLCWNLPQQVSECSARITPYLVYQAALCMPSESYFYTLCSAFQWHFDVFHLASFFFFSSFFNLIFFPKPSDLLLGSATVFLHINCHLWKYQTESSSLSASKEESVVFL